MFRKVFTVDEANSMIPLVEDAFRSIESHRDRIHEHGRKIEVLNLLWGNKLRDPSNPDHYDYAMHKRSIENEISEIERVIQDEILRRGIRFPVDGIENGLIDFPSTYQGRRIFLCWRNGEPELRYWHETDAGYPERLPITDEHKRVMGKDEASGRPGGSEMDG
jgi:hypothetical protein